MVDYINGKHGQGTNSTKMGADKSAVNTPNAQKFIYPNCLPKLNSLGFDEKRLNWASVVRGANNVCQEQNINQYFVDNLGKDS